MMRMLVAISMPSKSMVPVIDTAFFSTPAPCMGSLRRSGLLRLMFYCVRFRFLCQMCTKRRNVQDQDGRRNLPCLLYWNYFICIVFLSVGQHL